MNEPTEKMYIDRMPLMLKEAKKAIEYERNFRRRCEMKSDISKQRHEQICKEIMEIKAQRKCTREEKIEIVKKVFGADYGMIESYLPKFLRRLERGTSLSKNDSLNKE